MLKEGAQQDSGFSFTVNRKRLTGRCRLGPDPPLELRDYALTIMGSHLTQLSAGSRVPDRAFSPAIMSCPGEMPPIGSAGHERCAAPELGVVLIGLPLRPVGGIARSDRRM